MCHSAGDDGNDDDSNDDDDDNVNIVNDLNPGVTVECGVSTI